LDQRDDVGWSLGNGYGSGDNAIHPGTFCVGGADAGIGQEHTSNLTPMNHNVKLRSSMARAQLIHIEVDRRLGHEWDEWNGRPLPGGGDFSAPPGLFFRFAALTIVAATAAVALLLYLIGPRLRGLWRPLPSVQWIALATLAALSALYLGVLAVSYYSGRNLLPERLMERGLYLKLMNYTSLVARAFGKRDWVEHAAIDVYNTLALRRGRKVGKGELLVLIPRCLSKQALDGVLEIAGRYDVPVFVATRGQLARRVKRKRSEDRRCN